MTTGFKKVLTTFLPRKLALNIKNLARVAPVALDNATNQGLEIKLRKATGKK